ncbi:GNAT family N-acetyltransferase [Pseudomonas aeruginosa]|uniref:GNAT family N-acetyltransferase n=1 Tax=Pseudomonas aeruginosa TaxID=287 RepID=UPI000937DECE|nr:GNAT family N-acetyltransferase [Pseudomonas aeruginosa]MCT5519289.1 N-acetyltransferase family protein [Pseudomonas aeruginosa]MEE2515645.1 N-acetyltransferase family protein [Pseudomonas aeruginosa]HEJ1327426.1 N-acetyltransferase [Pseudomonas aeruginosa]
MQLIHCTEERHAAAILEIFNHAILHSTALYDYKPREASSMVGWFETKRRNGFPVLGVEDEQGKLLGFASYGTFRAWPAYKYSVEHSIYIHHECRGMGLGKHLLSSLIDEATVRDVHTMVGGIDLANQASIALHERLGFEPAGVIKEVAYKFGRWLDLAFYQKVLATPTHPNED